MGVARAIFELFCGREEMTDEELQVAIDKSMERQWRARLPEAPGVLDDYLFFTGDYAFKHDASPMQSHEAAMKAHPEWWPETLPNCIYEPEPDYSP